MNIVINTIIKRLCLKKVTAMILIAFGQHLLQITQAAYAAIALS